MVRFSTVRADGILGAVDSAAGRAVASAVLEPLIAHDRDHRGALVATLGAWLDADGSHEATALALGVPRHTVRTRLALAERLLERDLASFAVRAELWAAFRLHGG